MNDKYFLDTNILVYSFDPKALAKAHRSAELIRSGFHTGKAVISYQVVQEFFQVAFTRFPSSMSLTEAQEYFTTILLPMLRVHSSPAIYSEALLWKNNHHLPWYDSLIVSAAIQAGCNVLYSEDFQHGQKFGSVRVVNPFV